MYKSDSQGASPVFQQHFRETSVVATVTRVVKFSAKEAINRSFEKYCVLNDIKVPSDYRMAFLNMQAGFKSVSKYDREPVKTSPYLGRAIEFCSQHFSPFLFGSTVISETEALSEMELSTSCGYPWSLAYVNKTDFLQHGNDAVLNDFWNLLGTDTTLYPIWTCAQKGEMRHLDKLKLNKIRTFTGSPIELSVAMNRLFFRQNEKFYDSAGETWSFVGTSKFFAGFDKLYRRLNVHPNAYALDESDYDASLAVWLLEAVMLVRLETLEDEHEKAMHVYEFIINSVIVLENGELWQKIVGNPSGSVNTIVDNTMGLFILLAIAWLELAPDYMMEYSDFTNHVEAALNGDDNTYTVSDEANVFFHPAKIAEVWTRYGVTTKTSNYQSQKLKDVDFLSQRFVYQEGMYLPSPDTEKVLCSLMYASEENDTRWHFLRACALRMDSWANVECRKIIQGYLNYLTEEHRYELLGTIRGIEMKHIYSCWKSDRFLRRLYTGLESNLSGEKEVPVPDKILNYYLEILEQQNNNQEKFQSKMPPQVRLAVVERKKKRRNTQKVVVALPTTKVRNKKSNRKRNTQIDKPGSTRHAFKEYIDTMNNPFDYGPIRLGFGTMVPTQLATYYCRGSFGVAGDGSFRIFLIPGGGTGNSGGRGGIYFGNITNTSQSAVSAPWSNTNVINSMGVEGRVVSGGIRVLPSYALTGKPGMLYTLNLPSDSFTNVATVLTSMKTYEHPLTQWSDGRLGASSYVRPSDYDSYSFHTSVQQGYADGSATFSSIPLISGLGFDINATIYFEAVLNVEILNSTNSTSTNYTGQESVASAGLSDYFSSVDSLWSSAKSLLSNPTVQAASKEAYDWYKRTGNFETANHSAMADMFSTKKHVTQHKEDL